MEGSARAFTTVSQSGIWGPPEDEPEEQEPMQSSSDEEEIVDTDNLVQRKPLHRRCSVHVDEDEDAGDPDLGHLLDDISDVRSYAL